MRNKAFIHEGDIYLMDHESNNPTGETICYYYRWGISGLSHICTTQKSYLVQEVAFMDNEFTKDEFIKYCQDLDLS